MCIINNISTYNMTHLLSIGTWKPQTVE